MKDIPDAAAPLLEKWNRGNAKLWSYVVSFQQLVIRVEKDNVKGNLQITCSPCLKIKAPAMWKPCSLKIAKVEDSALLGATFHLEDDAAGVLIECMGIHFDENVEPVY